jgi:hypothetical protein
MATVRLSPFEAAAARWHLRLKKIIALFMPNLLG